VKHFSWPEKNLEKLVNIWCNWLHRVYFEFITKFFLSRWQWSRSILQSTEDSSRCNKHMHWP